MSDAQGPTPGLGDQARVSVTVGVPIDDAFRLFAGEIDRWWRHGRKFRNAPDVMGIMHIEPGVGGRLFESYENEGGHHVIETGRVLVWEPPRRLVFSWRNVTFTAGERTEVEVLFAARGGTTVVSIIHRGWSSLPVDHPARHGLSPSPFARMIGLWWGEQMTSLRMLAAARE